MDSFEHNQKVARGFQRVINAMLWVILGIMIGNSGLPGHQLNTLQNVLYFVIFLCAIASMYFGQYKVRHHKQK